MSQSRAIFKKILPVVAALCLIIGSVGLFTAAAHAQTSTNDLGLNEVSYTGLANTDIRVTAAKIIRAALGLLGIISLVLVLYGGFVYMTAGGSEEKVAQGKKILVNAGIGLVIIFSAFGIVSFVLRNLVSATTGDIGPGGNSGNGGGDETGGEGGFGQAFYVSSLPQNGAVCIRNIHPQIVFNKEVQLSGVQDAILVLEKSTKTQAPGSWIHGATKNIIIYDPADTCAPLEGSDCFKANTEYTIEFKDAANIKSLTEPALTLNCRLKAGCRTVEFKSGDGVDRVNPTVSITYPANYATLEAGSVVPVKVTYNDDNGVQGVSLATVNGTDRELVNSLSFAGCKKTDTVTINWSTQSSKVGNQVIEASATDWAGQSGKTTSNVVFKPNHCFNGEVETNLGEERAGPPECGGVCGACSGTVCKNGSECASGDCINGVCANVMRITGFSPRSGAPGTFVTVNGHYFGSTAGKIYFATKNDSDINNAAEWIQAELVNCSGNVNNWSGGQVIVRVPVGAASSSHIKVESAPFINASGVQQKNIDATSKRELDPFEVNGVVRPNICTLSPISGQAGDVVSVLGNAFGLVALNTDSVTFGGVKALVVPDQNNQPVWTESRISVAVPVVGSGSVGVQVVKNNVESNSVRFNVQSGSSATAPFISEISPNKAPAGTYLTITGKNFGTQVGIVTFRTAQNATPVLGDTAFPKECAATFWSDEKIIVKFPLRTGVVNVNYVVQVKTADAKTSSFDAQKTMTVEAGDPAPGICAIKPTSGPVPFPTGQSVELFGEYFVTTNNPTAAVYFWNIGALNPKSIDDRTAVSGAGVVKISANSATVIPPPGTISGPVSVYRPGDTKISNAAQFNAFDCRENVAQCGTGHCCLNGNQAGICKAAGEACSNEVVSAGYVWRFATRTIPPVPKVVERCESVGLPSPSPSLKWDENNPNGPHHNACRTALVTVEFNTIIDPSTVKSSSVVVNRCTAINGSTCVNPIPVNLKPSSFKLEPALANNRESHEYLSLQSVDGWAAGNLYQVALSSTIKSLNLDGQGVSLAADMPCDRGAYCFTFRAGADACVLKSVLVTPFNYYTQTLETPIRYRSTNGGGALVNYRAGGLSTQRCIMMDVSALPWTWETADEKFAIISGVNKGEVVNVGAKANTVGIVPNNTVDIIANTKVVSPNGESIQSGSSPLTVDLSNPQVVEYWPKCLEACTNARVGARFNVSMSKLHLDKNAIQNGSVQLLKCNDENCLSTTEVGDSADIFLTDESNGTILEIANSTQATDGDSKELEPNTIYKVIISASSTKPNNDPAVIWSRGQANNAFSTSKPYNQEFTWRFKTKPTRCTINRAEVLPKEFVARLVNEKSVYVVQPYSSPDACSAEGQKLNPWSVAWDWKTSNEKVASIKTFSTQGKSQYCTGSCVRKGSDIPSTVATRFSVCGNNVIEAGEDCENPSKTGGCSLDCRWMGTTDKCGNKQIDPGEACDASIPNTTGCNAQCLYTGSSAKTSAQDVDAAICGNGLVGQGESCDIGIPGDVTLSSSTLYCSKSCLHVGTTLSADWCFTNLKNNSLGGFDQKQFEAACAKSYSRCGNGIEDPNEDPKCDLGNGTHEPWCNDYCLANDKAHSDNGCTVGAEGCSETGQKLGSSLQYSSPSVCGDAKAEIGEDAFCEANIPETRAGMVDPWVVAIAKGRGTASGNPPKQTSKITAATNQQTQGGAVTGNALFSISCGYNNNKECSDVFGPDYGVGANTCCFARPKVTSMQPKNNTTNVCRNTAIEAAVNTLIDERTLSGNILLARGTTNATCEEGTIDVSNLLAVGSVNAPEKIWYKRIAHYLGSIFASEAEAAFTPPSKWCAGGEQGASYVSIDPVNTSTSHIHITLDQALATSSYYTVIIKDGLKDLNGASLNTTTLWKFETAANICEVNAVTVEPSSWLFTKANAQKKLTAVAHTDSISGRIIQPISGVYSWYYNWQPVSNNFVLLSNTTSSVNTSTANNRNGEVDVRPVVVMEGGSANKVLDNSSAHITVNLCENIWPSNRIESNNQFFSAFPFSDAKGNTSGVNSNKAFDGSAIPPSAISTKMGDGYFNFSTHYCADSGSVGTFDDLPYLKPAIQTAATDLERNSGSCEVTGKSCKLGDDCGTYYGGNGGFVVNSNATGICSGKDTTGKVHTFFNATSDPVGCIAPADCSQTDFSEWATKNSYSPTCATQPSANKRKLSCYTNAPLKRFIFTSTNNSDAVGIQVFANPEHLSPAQWFSNKKSAGGQGFGGTVKPVAIPAGYDAVSDGDNLYVAALNYSEANKGLYSDIYLFSVSQNAKPQTREVFQQMIGNLRFNTNITHNDGYCGTSMTNPSFITPCNSDLDCSGTQICVNQLAKLKNNFRRYNDLKKIESILDGYANQHSNYPALNVGSFLPGQSLSSWDWAGLASVVGQGLPKDPVEKLGKRGTCKKNVGKLCYTDSDCAFPADTCAFHDSKTGWSTEDRRFSFACAPSSYAYRYQFSTSTGYDILNRFENPGLAIVNTQDFLAGFHFNNIERFKSITGAQSTICNGEEEVRTISVGTCGDGQVNVAKGEQCDPPLSQVFDRSACKADGSGTLTTKTCNLSCLWETKVSAPSENACVDFNKCGNGRIDSGEQCDDGKKERGGQNGKWNKCTNLCTFPPKAPPEGPGYCGDKIIEGANEVCDAGHVKVSYSNVSDDCTPIQTCQNKEVCDPKKCKVDGISYNDFCTDVADCRGYLSGFQQALQPWYAAAGGVSFLAPSSNEIQITTSLAGTYNINYQSNGSYCNYASSPYKCHAEFTYSTAFCATNYGHVDFTIDKSQCSGGICPSVITSMTNNTACAGTGVGIGSSQVTVVLKRNESLACEKPANATCRTEVDQSTCVTTNKCVTRRVATTTVAAVGEPTYGVIKAASCNWDCQNTGPYCGDGVVQSEFGEECDGNITCPVGGVSGTKTCNASCKFNDSASAAWWALDVPSSDGYTFVDRNGTANGSCEKGSCPVYNETGGPKNGGNYRFTGSDVVKVADKAALMPTTVMSIEAWIKPEANPTNFARVIEKGGYTVGGGYDLETNYKSGDAINNRVAFNVWGADGTTSARVYSKSELPLNQWTYVVATYEYQPTTEKESLKIYLNGKITPDSEELRINVKAPTLAKNTKEVTIGGRATGGNYFIGSLNNVRVLNRVLQPNEVKDRFENAWPCTVPARSSVLTAAAGTCGDGQVDPSEVCDLGEKNGVTCNPAYGQTCTFCQGNSAPGKNDGCKNTYNVRSEQFCGDGIIQGAEVCETDQATGDIYASAQSQTSTLGYTAERKGYKVLQCNAEVTESNVFKKGTKTCSNDCKRLFVQETNTLACVTCGINTVSGVTVQGNIINVVDVKSKNPLYADSLTPTSFSQIILRGGICPVGSFCAEILGREGLARVRQSGLASNNALYELYYDASATGGISLPKIAPLNSNPLCSAPANDVKQSYNISINNSDPFIFPISAEPTSWQYDLVVSPIISIDGLKDQTGRIAGSSRPNDMRVVVSWVGATDFSAGFVRSMATESVVEDAVMTANTVAGYNYFSNTKTRSDTATIPWNIWYHGKGVTNGGISVESFTLDTSRMSNDNYKFYVRTSNSNDPIKNYKTSALVKVEVYLPKTGEQMFYKTDRPVKTFYLSGADISSNTNAGYWHVFTIDKNGAPIANKIRNAAFYVPNSEGTATLNENYPNGRIVGGVTEMY